MNERVSLTPARASAAAAMCAALVATGAVGLYSEITLLLGGVAILLVTLGVVVGTERAVGAGVLVLFLGLLVAGLAGAPPLSLLVAGTATVIVWDVGENAISIGKQLGADATTIRIELTHALGSLFAGGLATGLGYWIFVSGADGRPLAAVLFLLVGAVILISILRIVDTRDPIERARR